MMEFSDLATYASTGAVGGGSVGGVFYYLMRRILDRQDKLENEVKQLRDKELAEVKSDIKDHLKKDNGAVTSAVLGRIEGGVNKLSDKIDRFAESSAKQQAEIQANKDYIENIDKSLQRHKEMKHAS